MTQRAPVVMVVAVFGLVGGGGCGSGSLVAGPPDHGPKAPVNVLEPIGTDATLDIGAWNLKNFPCGNASNSTVCRDGADQTPAKVAALIEKLDVDLLSVEEIDSEDAFNQVVSLLPGREGVLSTQTYFDGTYQKVGFIYKSDILTAGNPVLLFDGDGAFPRPPLMVPFTWVGPGTPLAFVAISVHLKAGSTPEDFNRRQTAIAELEQAVRTQLVEQQSADVIVLGDWNESVTSTEGAANFAPFADGARYDIRTKPIAEHGAVSFLPSGSMIDHIVTTAGFAPVVGNVDALAPRLDDDVTDYIDTISDHLPVFLSLAHP